MQCFWAIKTSNSYWFGLRQGHTYVVPNEDRNHFSVAMIKQTILWNIHPQRDILLPFFLFISFSASIPRGPLLCLSVSLSLYFPFLSFSASFPLSLFICLSFYFLFLSFSVSLPLSLFRCLSFHFLFLSFSVSINLSLLLCLSLYFFFVVLYVNEILP